MKLYSVLYAGIKVAMASDRVEISSFVLPVDQTLDTLRVRLVRIHSEYVMVGVLSALLFNDIRDASLTIPRLIHWEYSLSLHIVELTGCGWRCVEVYLLRSAVKSSQLYNK